MPKIYTLIIIVFLGLHQVTAVAAEAAPPQKPVFELVVLGDAGGIHDGNLSAFLLRSLTDNQYIGLDAGTIVNGIVKAVEQNAFNGIIKDPTGEFNPAINILRHHVAAYLISHAHLDHVSGLVIASPEDSAKPIFGLPSVNKALIDSYFNWQVWPNFTDRGVKPQLNKYQMIDLSPAKTVRIPNTSLSVSAYSLSHTVESTAFVIENDNEIMVYFGDTGPDAVEKEGKLDTLWRHLAAQIKHKNLRAIIIEVSFPDGRPDSELYGHLTPAWLSKELTHFASLLDKPDDLRNTTVIISHVKPSKFKNVDARALIKHELEQHNKLDLSFIMATQGQKILF